MIRVWRLLQACVAIVAAQTDTRQSKKPAAIYGLCAIGHYNQHNVLLTQAPPPHDAEASS